MIVAEYRNNRVYKAVKELYELELHHEVRAERLREVIEEMNPSRAELIEYNNIFGIHKEVDETGNYVTKIHHPNGERIIVTRYGRGEIGSDGERGLLTIEGRRAKHAEPFFLLTPETMLEAIRRVRAQTMITPFEKDTLLDALCEF